MITFYKTSTISGREKRKECSLEQAIVYIAKLTVHDFRNAQLFAFSHDLDNKEINTLISAFDNYEFVLQNSYIVDMYEIIRKPQKNSNGIKTISIVNFKNKIERNFPDYECRLTLIPTEKKFIIVLSNREIRFEFICNYFLENISSSVIPLFDKETLDVEQVNLIQKKINSLFAKQRYYYRRKYKNV